MRGDTDIYIIDLRENEQRETDKKEREIFDENIWDWRRKKKKKEERMGYDGKGRDWFDIECEDHNDVHMEIGKLRRKQAKPKSQ